jgi:hypothetical protein
MAVGGQWKNAGLRLGSTAESVWAGHPGAPRLGATVNHHGKYPAVPLYKLRVLSVINLSSSSQRQPVEVGLIHALAA